MQVRKYAAVAALAAAAMGLTAGTSAAAPTVAHVSAAPTPVTPGIKATPQTGVNFTATNTGSQAIISTDAGSLVNDQGTLKIVAATGAVVASLPLNFHIDDYQFPIEASIHGTTATLTPKLDMAHAVYKPVDLPFQDQAPWKTPYDREVAAFTRMKDTIATGAAIGGVTGLIGGGVTGCILGGIVGATTTGVVTGIVSALVAALPGAIGGAIGGCIIGTPIGAGIGAVAGAILVTAPVAIAAVIQYVTTINEPFHAAPSAPQKVQIVK